MAKKIRYLRKGICKTCGKKRLFLHVERTDLKAKVRRCLTCSELQSWSDGLMCWLVVAKGDKNKGE